MTCGLGVATAIVVVTVAKPSIAWAADEAGARPLMVVVDPSVGLPADAIRDAIAQASGARTVSPQEAAEPTAGTLLLSRAPGGALVVAYFDRSHYEMRRTLRESLDKNQTITAIALLSANLARDQTRGLFSPPLLRDDPYPEGSSPSPPPPNDASVSPRAKASSKEKAPRASLSEMPGTPSNGSTARTLGWVALGVGAASVAFGGIAAVFAQNDSTRLTVLSTKVSASHEDLSDAAASLHAHRFAADLAFASGAAELITGGVLLLCAPTKHTPEKASGLVPWVGAGAAGLRGAF